MNTHKSSFLNALILILFGCWAYFTSESPSMTSLIPVFFGFILILFNKGLKNKNKIAAHLVVVLTLIILVALFMPLKAAIGRADNIAIVRVSVMLLSTIFAFYYQIQSFVNARRKSK
tara:strand:- start:135 stop:485 length:351 start_codon:yes stop_codon:yes gene_type:complete